MGETTQLTDSYITKLLKAQFKRWGEPDKEVEPWMIEMKRNQLLYTRKVRQLKQLIKDGDSVIAKEKEINNKEMQLNEKSKEIAQVKRLMQRQQEEKQRIIELQKATKQERLQIEKTKQQ